MNTGPQLRIGSQVCQLLSPCSAIYPKKKNPKFNMTSQDVHVFIDKFVC